MSSDYRIGLIVGTALAGVALLWVATRPRPSPRPYPMPATQDVNAAAAGRRPASDASARYPEQPPHSRPIGVDELLSSPDRPAVSAAPRPVTPDGNEPVGSPRFHIVRSGETLSSIAQQYYGSSNAWPRILEANKAVKDANKIALGTKLIIPE